MTIDYKNSSIFRHRFSIDEDGEYNGLYRSWDSNGKLYFEINLKNGECHGLYRSWY